ncbi:hypothetical protein [Streptomyces sp. NPDC029526]|uniref:hypothetical protein n=1 Tax=Streptomyces sp. NPDC029526 TaxID=3155728 RepID=UPI0033E510B6
MGPVVRRPVAWLVALVLLVEAFGVAAVNWFLGVVVDRQDMSLAGLDPHMMSVSSKVGAVVFGLYFAFCALVALLVGVRDRAPAGLGRVLLVSAAVVHGLLAAFAWGLVGPSAFVYLVVVLGLIVLLLMTYDRPGPSTAHRTPDPRDGTPGTPHDGTPHDGTPGPQDSTPGPQDGTPRRGPAGDGGAPVTPPAAPTAP